MPPMTTESLPAPAPTRRQELIDRLAEPRQYDLAVIGGGATGLGVALDAAARGFSVVLVESHDFAKGTSSRATKLVHGGVRYLAQGNISLVREALHELDVAFNLARETHTSNVLLEFLEYDRSIVLAALGDITGAQASYRRYLRLVGPWSRSAQISPAGDMPAAVRKRPLEPFFLKSADRFILQHIGEALPVGRLAEHCGVSLRTLEKAFTDLRGLTPVAHMRNLRLDHARRTFDESDATVAEVAARFGFGSSTTFALEYRKRFGMAPSRTKRAIAN